MTERCSSRGAASLSSCRCLLGLRLTVVSLWNKTKQRAFIHRITLPEIMSKGKLSLGNWLHTKMVHKTCIYCLNNKVNIQVNAMQIKKQNQRWTLWMESSLNIFWSFGQYFLSFFFWWSSGSWNWTCMRITLKQTAGLSPRDSDSAVVGAGLGNVCF